MVYKTSKILEFDQRANHCYQSVNTGNTKQITNNLTNANPWFIFAILARQPK